MKAATQRAQLPLVMLTGEELEMDARLAVHLPDDYYTLEELRLMVSVMDKFKHTQLIPTVGAMQ